jgi:hypothetical protein
MTTQRTYVPFDQVKRNIAASLGIEDTITKGQVDAVFTEAPLVIPKTGKEIKENLDKVYFAKANEFAAVKARVDLLLDLLPAEPEQDITKADATGLKQYISALVPYKVFTEDKTYYRADSNAGIATPTTPQVKNDCDICKSWNEAVDDLFNKAIELGTISTVNNGIIDQQIYNLTPSQLKTLQF